MTTRTERPAPPSADAGFTLIELMIVVAIIAVLSGILIPNFVHARGQSATAACQANMQSIATAAELYFTDNENYPTDGPATINFGNASTPGRYLNNTPVDPAANNASATYTFTNDSNPGAPHFIITCPGTHDPASLTKINGGTVVTTPSKLSYTSDHGVGIAASTSTK